MRTGASIPKRSLANNIYTMHTYMLCNEGMNAMRTSIIISPDLHERIKKFNEDNPGREIVVAKVCRVALEAAIKPKKK